MASFVYDGTSLPNGKVDADPLVGPANESVTSVEWNNSMQAVYDLRTAILTGDYTGLTSNPSAAVSPSGGVRFRSNAGVLEISQNAGAYAPVALLSTGGTGITAHAGGGQASATPLTKDVNFVTVCATAGDSVKLPVAVLGKVVTVRNDGATAVAIFPQSGSAIGQLGTNASFSLGAGSSMTFLGQSTTAWKTAQQPGLPSVFNASDLGMAPTNTAAANAAAWGAAMTAATTGDTWVFPAGRYDFNAAITLSKRLNVVGQGSYEDVEFRFTASTDGLLMRCNEARVSDIWFHGTDSATGAGIKLQASHCVIDAGYASGFKYGMEVYGDTTNYIADCNEIRSFIFSQNGTHGTYLHGPDAQVNLFHNCSFISNSVNGVYDDSFLGNTFVNCHSATNTTHAYETTNSNQRTLFLNCYTEGETSVIVRPSMWIGGRSTTSGSGINFSGADFSGYQVGFNFYNAYGNLTLGSMQGDNWFATRTTPSASSETHYDTFTASGIGTITNLWRVHSHNPASTPDAYALTTSDSVSSISHALLDNSRILFRNGYYIGTTAVRPWLYFEEAGTPVDFAASLLGSGKTLHQGDRFENYYTNATQGGLSANREAKYAGHITTTAGTLGTYGDGRTATTDGSATFVLSGANTSLTKGQWIVVGAGSATVITGISGTSITVASSGALPAASSGNAIVYSAPGLSAYGQITGRAKDSTASPGNATQRTLSGRAAFAASTSAVTITNDRVTTSSIIHATVQTLDANLTQILQVIPSNGFFTVYANQAAFGTTNFCWNIVE